MFVIARVGWTVEDDGGRTGRTKVWRRVARDRSLGCSTEMMTYVIITYMLLISDWTHDDLTAQAVAFLLAGFDTSSTLLCFTAYELALHPDLQIRLQAEIDEVMTRTQGKLSYAELQKMKYMDMVVSGILKRLFIWFCDLGLNSAN